jgi:serine/threonine-protein kinase
MTAGAEIRVHRAHTEDGAVAALKLAHGDIGCLVLAHEERVLRCLPVGPWPAVIGAGVGAGWDYLALSWVPGADLRAVATELRLEGSRRALARLCADVAKAYAKLHACGVLHGSVHPRNVRVDGDGSVGLLDFAAAAVASPGSGADCADAGPLGAVLSALSAPEHAAAVDRGEAFRPTAESEQHALAALLYLTVTGCLYAALPGTRTALGPAILAARPLPFAEQGAAPWRQLEEVLARGLAREARERHASLSQFAAALSAVADATADPQGVSRRQPVSVGLSRMLDDFARDAREPGDGPPLPAPTCSVNYGAAGIAFALYRIWKATGNASSLRSAEAWLARAESDQQSASAFASDEITPSTVGTVTPYHSASGLAAVRAFVDRATGNPDGQHAAIDRFCASVRQPCADLDLTLGRSSVLLFAALLLASADPNRSATRRLREHGDALCHEIWAELPSQKIRFNGIAHGWAGIAYAALSWTRARGLPPPSGVAGVLERLVAAAQPYGRGRCWPYDSSPEQIGAYWSSWCHGHAGYVFLWNLAHMIYGEAAFAELAEGAARLTVDRRTQPANITSLCCGSAGAVYAVLNHHRATGEEIWRSRAQRLAEDSAREPVLASDATSPLSLYKGHAGLALLAAELERPELAAMPLFELEPPLRS